MSDYMPTVRLKHEWYSFFGWVMVVYALLINNPVITAQRYNRLRFQKLQKKLKQMKRE